MDLEYRSDRVSTHPDAPLRRPPRPPRWSQITTPSHSTPVVEPVGPSHQPTPAINSNRGFILDESARAYRTTALRQLNGSSARPWSASSRHQAHHHPPPTRSTLASQPVLVRAYSGGPHDSQETSKMPSRRSFLFTGGSGPGSSSSSGSQNRGPPLPSHEDFGIDSILRAIEPNIRGTLESIGEICGRSKLSLANEYDSHIAPLGEIRAPAGGLLTVEEASSDHERQLDNVVIYDDEPSLVDGRDGPRSHAEYWDHRLPHGAAVYPSTIPLAREAPPIQPTTDARASDAPAVPTTREFVSSPKTGGRAFLQKQAHTSGDDHRQRILTPAVVSEVLLDARAESHQHGPPLTSEVPDEVPAETGVGAVNADADVRQQRWRSPSESERPSMGADAQALFGWLRTARDGRTDRPTAEMRLRAMLERPREVAHAE
ncbi:hypothetical protein P168DRAFT_291005 [Aspergillus campestris IBT 28561]|uniref:Uncharacterized protein n=1 Tax=Aspergillus campestris (strain IBT 28561) TaxID=1392248 RepID=A0A2I1D223_ASPC2|nr:uncharacterized protein P168DRAFT_291005 [Aspergillus campestris IBT 28561]PKY03909.1 hypothetical protein P168DRAFT_291005 [Aspergillus campestris IBT 28561]